MNDIEWNQLLCILVFIYIQNTYTFIFITYTIEVTE